MPKHMALQSPSTGPNHDAPCQFRPCVLSAQVAQGCAVKPVECGFERLVRWRKPLQRQNTMRSDFVFDMPRKHLLWAVLLASVRRAACNRQFAMIATSPNTDRSRPRGARRLRREIWKPGETSGGSQTVASTAG
eukprot:5771812-Alexandrium_andersonii.AAC.1